MERIADIRFLALDECAAATGVVVVIDVCRAFTTAAYALAAGAERILLAGTVEEALALRQRFPGSKVIGEVGGLPVAEFDLWNSPVQVRAADLKGCTLVQRTTAGTQGVVRAAGAELMLTASFAVATATAQHILQYAAASPHPVSVHMVMTGAKSNGDPRLGLEDRACAEFLAALLRGQSADVQDFLRWRGEYMEVSGQGIPDSVRSNFLQDIDLCEQPDTFPFAMVVTAGEGLRVLTAVPPHRGG
eukprot:GGOE01014097.1.p2 GENE.GGOE01014097.1~~GGOE01014097.1.p2  ORF type:complete len:256 (+),score=68.17 GGOE01014097.1:32-769(+)